MDAAGRGLGPTAVRADGRGRASIVSHVRNYSSRRSDVPYVVDILRDDRPTNRPTALSAVCVHVHWWIFHHGRFRADLPQIHSANDGNRFHCVAVNLHVIHSRTTTNAQPQTVL